MLLTLWYHITSPFVVTKMSAASLGESEDYIEEYTSEHSDNFVSSLDEFQNTMALLDLEVDEVDNAIQNSLEEVHIGDIFSSTDIF